MSVKTCFTSDQTTPTSGLTEHGSTDTVTVSTASSGDRYLYYEVTDQAGNVTRGFSGEIHADGTVPAAPTVTQAEGLENQQERAVLTISAGTAGPRGSPSGTLRTAAGISSWIRIPSPSPTQGPTPSRRSPAPEAKAPCAP